MGKQLNENISLKILKNLYSVDFEILTPDNKKMKIPESGSLGLLALGYKGLIAWRKAKKENLDENKKLL